MGLKRTQACALSLEKLIKILKNCNAGIVLERGKITGIKGAQKIK